MDTSATPALAYRARTRSRRFVNGVAFLSVISLGRRALRGCSGGAADAAGFNDERLARRGRRSIVFGARSAASAATVVAASAV